MKDDFRPTAADYERVYQKERANTYPVVDAYEQRLGYAVDRESLEEAARILACPVKANLPCWQHGRVLYATARKAFERPLPEPVTVLDLGTAKGFSALCLRWALDDAKVAGEVVTLDVLDPHGRSRRNSVFELDGGKTLAEFLAPWPEAEGITALKSTGIAWLVNYQGRLPMAFVDGKHTGEVVAYEGREIAKRQEPGDYVMFDDIHIPDVAAAVKSLDKYFALETIQILPHRGYAVGVRR